MKSQKFSLDVNDGKKLLKGGLIAGAGAFLAAVSDQIIPWMQQADEVWVLAAGAALSVLVNGAQKFLKESRYFS